jgi:MFS superfamily sulfate permease-like transporter
MSLQSYLFFGSANRLYQQVKELFANQPGCRFLVFDFRLVTGVDSSAMHSFTQIKQVADELGARLVLVNLSHELGIAFRTRGYRRRCYRRLRPRSGARGLRAGGDRRTSRRGRRSANLARLVFACVGER